MGRVEILIWLIDKFLEMSIIAQIRKMTSAFSETNIWKVILSKDLYRYGRNTQNFYYEALLRPNIFLKKNVKILS